MFKIKMIIPVIAISFLCSTSFADIRSLVVNQQGSSYISEYTRKDWNQDTLMISAHSFGVGIVSGVGAFKTAPYGIKNLFNGFRIGYQGFKTSSPLIYRQAIAHLGKGIAAGGIAATCGFVSLLGLGISGEELYAYATEDDRNW